MEARRWSKLDGDAANHRSEKNSASLGAMLLLASPGACMCECTAGN